MCKVMFTVIFIFIFIKASEQSIELKLDLLRKDKFGNNVYSYDNKLYSVEGNIPLTIIFTKSSSTAIDQLQCWNHLFSYDIGTFPVGFDYLINKYTLKISTVTIKMSGTWKCEIREYSSYFSGYTYQFIYFNVRLKNVEPPQLMIVNEVALITRRESDKYYTAEYKYSEDDMINAVCINGYDKCTVQINYDNSDELGITSNEGFSVATGLRISLLAHHNNTRMVCTLSCGQNIFMLDVLFKLQESFAGIMNIEINNQKLRGGQLKDDTIYYNYFYFINAKPTSTAVDANCDDTILSSACDFCYLNDQKIEQLNRASKIIYTANNKTNPQNIFERIEVGFTPLNLKDEDVLSINLPIENILKEEYVINKEHNGILTYKVKWIYYDFKDGDTLTIKCSTTAQHSQLAFNGTVTNQTHYNQTITLRLSNNNTVFTCINTEKNRVWGRIHVVFRTSMPNNTDEFIWVLVVVGLLMVIVVVFVCFGIYRMRKRPGHDRMQGSVATIQSDADTSIPPYPAQWESNYANIKKDINITNKNHNKRTEELYANIQPSGGGKSSETENYYTNDKIKSNDDVYVNQSACEVTKNTNSPDQFNLQYANPKDFDFVFKNKKGKIPPNDTTDYAQISFKNMESNDNDEYANINKRK